MNCKGIEQHIQDYQVHNLDQTTQKLVEEHLKECRSCRSTHQEFIQLMDTINEVKEELPEDSMQLDFHKMLEREKAILYTDEVKVIRIKKSLYKHLLQMVAAMILMVCSYFYGSYKNSSDQREEMVFLEQEKNRMQELASMSLMDNESASKRLQAVSFAENLEHPDHKILEVLIIKMKTDKHVNVRLAAANALAKFTYNTMVRSALVETLETEDNANMQIELIQILVDVAEKRAIPTMKKLLENSETPSYLKDQINSELKQII